MNRKLFGIPLLVLVPLVIVLLLVLLVVVNIGSIIQGIGSVLTFIFYPDTRDFNIVVCSESSACAVLHPILFSAVLAFVILTGFAYTTLLERRLIAALQHRVGPNRVGPAGLLQPLADAIKLIFKEDVEPAQADRFIYRLAPMLKTVPVLIVIGVIPLGPDILLPWFDGNWYQVPLGLSDPSVGILWILAITSIGTYGVTLAGWASNNKYAMLGGMRAAAQMISYELSLGLALAVPVMLAGSMSLGDIMNQQKNIWDWYVFQNPLAAAILLLALLAEVNRAPFDLPEAEQELTAGYMTEYSGMKFAAFMMAEYIGMIAVSMIAAATFFGGFHLIPVDNIPIAGPINMILKVFILLAGMVWVRATLPRIRYDRLMSLGWKVLLPLAIVAVIWTALAVIIGESYGPGAYTVISGLFFLATLVGGYLLLRRAGQPDDDAATALEDDPFITGERGGAWYTLLLLLGTLVSIPFVIIGWFIRLFEGLEEAGKGPSESSAIEEVSGGS